MLLLAQKAISGAVSLAMLASISSTGLSVLAEKAPIIRLLKQQPKEVAEVKPPEIKVKKVSVTLTAYSSTPDQTDDTPFITAAGTTVRDGVVAANFLPLSTKIKIPEIYGDKIFVVEDRMNRRYQDRVDIWFPDRESANIFGVKEAEIHILTDEKETLIASL